MSASSGIIATGAMGGSVGSAVAWSSEEGGGAALGAALGAAAPSFKLCTVMSYKVALVADVTMTTSSRDPFLSPPELDKHKKQYLVSGSGDY